MVERTDMSSLEIRRYEEKVMIMSYKNLKLYENVIICMIDIDKSSKIAV